jgi:hypothetical protein
MYLDEWLNAEALQLPANIPWGLFQSFWTTCLQTDYVEQAKDKESAEFNKRTVLSVLRKMTKNPVIFSAMGMNWWIHLVDEPSLFWDALLVVIKISNYHVPSLGTSLPPNWQSTETNRAFFTGIITDAPVLPEIFVSLFLKYPEKRPLFLALMENHPSRFQIFQKLLSQKLKGPEVIFLLEHWAETCGKRLSLKARASSNRALLEVVKSRPEFSALALLAPDNSQGQEQRPLYRHSWWVIQLTKPIFFWKMNISLDKAYLTYIKNPVNCVKTLCAKTMRAYVKLRKLLPMTISILSTQSSSVFDKVKNILLEGEKSYFFWKYTEGNNSWKDYAAGLLVSVEGLYEKAKAVLAQKIDPKHEKAIQKVIAQFIPHKELADKLVFQDRKTLMKLSKLLEKDEKRFQKYEPYLSFKVSAQHTSKMSPVVPARLPSTPNRRFV